MLGTASSPATRIVSNRLICLGTVLLAVLAVLALSPAAHADSTLEAPTEGLSSGQGPEGSGGGEAPEPEPQPTGGTEGSPLETPGSEGPTGEALGTESTGSETGGPVLDEPVSEPPVEESAPEPTPDSSTRAPGNTSARIMIGPRSLG